MLSVVSQFIFMKAEKRLKDTEADTKELEYLEKQISFLSKRVDDLYIDLGKSEAEKRRARHDLEESEIKRYKLKRCISSAHNCKNREKENSDDCPVLLMQRKLEDEWIQMQKVENDTNDTNNE